MPLSENEQRLLEQMERALYAEDPKWASAMRGAVRRSSSARRLLLGIVGVVVGLVLLLVGVAGQQVIVGIAGFLVMLAAFAYTVSSRKKPGPTGVVNRAGTVRPVTPNRRRRGSFMQRLEERWERRRDERGPSPNRGLQPTQTSGPAGPPAGPAACPEASTVRDATRCLGTVRARDHGGDRRGPACHDADGVSAP